MPNPQKIQKVKEYEEMLSDLKSMVVVDYRGLSVAEANELRSKARDAQVSYRVVKNNLFKRALESNEELANMQDKFIETRAVAVSKADEVAPMKVLSDFAKKHEQMKIICGYLDGQVLDEKEVNSLAKLPSREELMGQIAGGIQAPTQYVASGINAVFQKLAIAINAMKEKREEEEKSA